MSRVIKFRAFNKSSDKMVCLHKTTPLSLDIDLLEAGANSVGVYLPDHNDIILMQYTGLTDKNGKEIYEGNLICLNGDKDMICACRWNVRYSCFDLYFSDVNDLSDGIDIWGNIGAEIIGNIYENKEVLDA